jgi:hypothetical protein
MVSGLKTAVALFIAINVCSCVSSINPYGPVSCATWENEECGPTAECAALLYNRAQSHMSVARQLAKNGLFMSSAMEYRHAICLLNNADIRLRESKLQDFDDWQVAVTFGLERKIKESIKQCDMFINMYRWRQ